jgi:hypothetical protein
MARTTFSGPVKSDNGFEGDITGDVVGDVFIPVDSVEATGANQDTASATAYGLNLVANADDTAGVILPEAVIGGQVIIVNQEAANSLEVYPADGESINGGTANAPVTMGNAEAAVFLAVSGSAWITLNPSTPS